MLLSIPSRLEDRARGLARLARSHRPKAELLRPLPTGSLAVGQVRCCFYGRRRDGVGSTSVGLGHGISLSETQHFCWVFRVHMTTAIMPISRRRTVSVGFRPQAARAALYC